MQGNCNQWRVKKRERQRTLFLNGDEGVWTPMGKEPHKRVHHKWSTLHEPKQQYEREQQQYDVIQADDKQHEAPSPPLVHPSPNHPDSPTLIGFAGGPSDLSLLPSFASHVVVRLWTKVNVSIILLVWNSSVFSFQVFTLVYIYLIVLFLYFKVASLCFDAHQVWQEDNFKGAYLPNGASELDLGSTACFKYCPTACNRVQECESCYVHEFSWEIGWGDQQLPYANCGDDHHVEWCFMSFTHLNP